MADDKTPCAITPHVALLLPLSDVMMMREMARSTAEGIRQHVGPCEQGAMFAELQGRLDDALKAFKDVADNG